MRCETCGLDGPVIWRIAKWSDWGRTHDVCPLCGLRMMGLDETVGALDEKRFRITEEVRDRTKASA